MAAADSQAFFLTPPPRHLAELRIDTASSAVAFSAPCAAAKGAGRKKRRCLVPASSVRKRMLLELAPFDFAPAPATSSSTPPPPPTPSPSSTLPPSPMAPAPSPSPAGEFSFATAPRVAVVPASPGNIFTFVGNATGTPRGSEARSGLSFSAPMGNATSFLAAPKMPTATGPTANGGFLFAAPPPEGPLTPTSTNTSGGRSFLASPRQPLTPMGSTASGGGLSAPSVPSLIPLKPAGNDTGDFFAFPSPACSQIGSAAPSAAAKESMPLAGLVTPPPRNSTDKMPSLFLRRAATRERRESLRELEKQQQFTPPPQEVTKTMSGSSASPCCTFFTSPSTKADKQEAKKVFSEASQSPARPATPEKEKKQEREVEVSSSPRERFSTSPAVFCSGAEVVVRVTCKCGVHKEFCFDHRL